MFDRHMLGFLHGGGSSFLGNRPVEIAHLEHLAESLGWATLPRCGVFNENYDWEARASAAPWAFTDVVHNLAQARGWAPPDVGVATAAQVNSKAWSNALAEEFDLPGKGILITEAIQVGGLGRQLPVMLKEPHGVSGGGNLLVRDARRLATITRHLDNQERRGLTTRLIAQPYFDVAHDFSYHLQISGAGEVEWLGLSKLHNTRQSFVAVEHAPALETRHAGECEMLGQRIARAAHNAGYCGPLSVDALATRDGLVVPLLEINARRTMGGLHLGLRRQLALDATPTALIESRVMTKRHVTEAGLNQDLRDRGLLFQGVGSGVLPIGIATDGASARACFLLVGDVLSAGAARSLVDRLLSTREAA